MDPYGDLKKMLEKGTLQVSHKALTSNSPVFIAMLGKDPRFLESPNNSPKHDGLQVVSFPEDQFEVMAIDANIVHPQFPKVPTKLSFLSAVSGRHNVRHL